GPTGRDVAPRLGTTALSRCCWPPGDASRSVSVPPDAVFRPDDAGEIARPAPAGKSQRRAGRAGRFGVLNAFTDCALADLAGAEVKVWLILFRDTKAATGTARTGQADIARRAGLEPRTVRRALAKLEAKGL